VAIVLTTVAALPVLGLFGTLEWPTIIGLLGGGALVALIGFADDRRHVAPRWRLLGHFAAATWILGWLGGLPPLPILGAVVDLGRLGNVLAVLYLVWLLNLTNFMDGIDGIAGVETFTVSIGGGLLYLIAAPGGTQWQAPLVLASATLGFLVWNWSPAKIFMGDAGSGFLGLMLAALSLQAARVQPALFWGWVILLGVFIVDATVTLLRRVAAGERFDEAHRSHAYQHAALRWGAHRPVTLAVAAINVGWLFPWAVVVSLARVDALYGVCLAYAPLLAAAIWLRAGRPA
jgi:Fuc2NAc and GlcNAc transferase